jgi:hypothetical protein
VEPPRIADAGTRVGGGSSARITALMCLIQDRDVLLPDLLRIAGGGIEIRPFVERTGVIKTVLAGDPIAEDAAVVAVPRRADRATPGADRHLGHAAAHRQRATIATAGHLRHRGGAGLSKLPVRQRIH